MSLHSPTPLFDNLKFIDLKKGFHHLDLFNNKPYAQKDYAHALQFLYSYRGSEATFNAYRREIERLLQWSWLVLKKSIRELRRHDIEAFITFCQHPPQQWIGVKTVARYSTHQGERKPHPDWRPFVATTSKMASQQGILPDIKKYALSQKALQAIFAICGSFYNYLIQEDYINFNPVAQIRQKSKFIRQQKNHRQVRRLSELQWSYVIETAEILSKKKPDVHHRTLFIMKALYGLYLRISELAASARWTPQMGHFQKDADGNWWFLTVGKGNKERLISVSDDLLNALKRYREHLGLTALPSRGETTPLIRKMNGGAAIQSTRQIRCIVQTCFDAAFLRMAHDGLEDDAIELKTATVHWLRHTGISEDIKHRPREHVRDDAGHSSSAITDQYIDVEMRARHASAKKKKLDPLA
ncbi:tyrosine-type recombinase/integrase [Rickettsiella grylli]|uniref:Site specific recombinase, phage integrase family n=1 Tax=Rickettsiella grylli TaxID=59196 RepID=A8PM20_9COXI|nr:tyrosine-type recombinase/integrase [Rickettsiella grylli]EDP46776.1 site specific recombinase, phage integrase family [Rickettsiella grylli]